MIDEGYAVSCMERGFKRYIAYNNIDATIECSENTISFYVKDTDGTGKQYLARSSDHHLSMQRMADKNQPWKGDNISIVFIRPRSPQDKPIRARVYQNSRGTIQPFDVMTYQYNPLILDNIDVSALFHAIIPFLNGRGFVDPFIGTPKAAKVKPTTANIKPYNPPHPKENYTVDASGTAIAARQNGYGADYVSESLSFQRKHENKVIRLTESDLRRIVGDAVKIVLHEAYAHMSH